MTGADTLDELHLLARAAARSRGDALFPALTQYIAKALNASESLISEVVDAGHVRTLAVFVHGAAEPNYQYELAGTPCAEVIRGEIVHYESGLAEKFPHTAQGYQVSLRIFDLVAIHVQPGLQPGRHNGWCGGRE